MHSTYVKSEATIPIGGCKSSGVESTSSDSVTTPFCRKKLDFETDGMGKVGENAALVIKKSKKNTAIVTGTIQQPNFNGGDFASAASLTKTNYRNQQQQQQPYGKIPSNSKRNARERRRVRTINDYFSQLQRYLPHSKPQINQSGSSGSSASVINTAKKMSKVETLKAAIEYIEYLLKYMPSNHQQVVPFSFSSSAAAAPSKSQTNLSTPIASSTSSSPSSLSSSSPSSSLLSSPTSVSSTSSKIQQLNSTHMTEKLKTKVKSPVTGQLLTQTTLQPGSNMSNFNYVPQLNKSLESTPNKPAKIGTNFSLQQSENMTYDTTSVICSNVQQPVYNGNSQLSSPSSSGYSNLNGQTMLANNPATDFNHSNYNGNYNTMGGYNGQSYTYYGDQTQTYGDASQQYNQPSSYSDSSNFSRVMMVDVHNQPAVNSTPVQYYNNTQTNAVYNNGSQSMSSFPANDYEMTVPPCVVQSPDSMIHSQPTGYLTTTQARSPLTNVNHQYCSKPQSLPSLPQQQSSQHGQIDYKSELYLTRQEPNANIY